MGDRSGWKPPEDGDTYWPDEPHDEMEGDGDVGLTNDIAQPPQGTS